MGKTLILHSSVNQREMEKLKAIKSIIWIAGTLFFLQLVMFIIMLRPLNTYMWISIAVLAILGIYFIRVSLSLAKELKERMQGGKGWDD